MNQRRSVGFRASLLLVLGAGLNAPSLLIAQSAATATSARDGAAVGGGQRPKQAGRAAAEKRATMERRLSDRINEVIRQKLSLTDEQFTKLRGVASHVEDDRRALRIEEVRARFALRQELLAGDRVNEALVGELLDRLPKLERRRLDLLEQEQRELSAFLTPSQRARYFALQDELRRGMQDVQRRRMGAATPEDTAESPRRGALRLRRPVIDP